MKKKKESQMRKLAGLFMMILCLTAGCGKEEALPEEGTQQSVIEKAEQEQPAEEIEEAVEKAEEELSAKLTNTVKEAYGNDEITLLTKESNDVHFVIPGNQHAEDKINEFFADRNAAFEDTIELYTDVVETAYEAWEATEDAGEWKTYELGRKYSVKRLDEQMICIVEDSYVNAGTDRTSNVRVSYNFDTWTGSRLSLEEVADHLDEIRAESVQYMGEVLLEEEYQEILKQDYANHLEDVLTDSTWYTDEEGFHIICNEGIIASEKEGILEFVLPYDEADVVDEVYLPEE